VETRNGNIRTKFQVFIHNIITFYHLYNSYHAQCTGSVYYTTSRLSYWRARTERLGRIMVERLLYRCKPGIFIPFSGLNKVSYFESRNTKPLLTESNSRIVS